MITSLFSFLVIPTVVLIIGVTNTTENIPWINKDSEGYLGGIIYNVHFTSEETESQRC